MTIKYKFRFWEQGRVPRFECVVCEQKFFNKLEVEEHYNENHKEEEKN